MDDSTVRAELKPYQFMALKTARAESSPANALESELTVRKIEEAQTIRNSKKKPSTFYRSASRTSEPSTFNTATQQVIANAKQR